MRFKFVVTILGIFAAVLLPCSIKCMSAEEQSNNRHFGSVRDTFRSAVLSDRRPPPQFVARSPTLLFSKTQPCDLSGNWTTTEWNIVDDKLQFSDYFDFFRLTLISGDGGSGSVYRIECLSNQVHTINARKYFCHNYNKITGDSIVWHSGELRIFNDTAIATLDSGATMFGYNISCASTTCGWTQTNPACNICGPQSVCPDNGNNAVPPIPCKQISFFDDWHALQWTQIQPPHTIRKVHLIFMNHLDVGYDGIPILGFINNIVNVYFHEYFPRAIAIARTLATETAPGGYVKHPPVKFVYTTHPWLVSFYLDCPKYFKLANISLVCPSDEEVRTFEEAIEEGWIVWHRGAFNPEPELMSQYLFKSSLQMAAELDARFPKKQRATVMSLRDVPGMTRGVIPLLNSIGVTAVSVGVNCGTIPPSVPKAFLWKDEASSTDMLAFWHPYGYPGSPGSDPSSPGGLSREDCITIEGFDEALCWAFRTDNSGGPLDTAEVFSNYGVVETLFPGAHVEASTFENFVDAALKVKDKLPVVSDEIGDVWIQGAASDPQKMSFYRALARGFEMCFADGKCMMTDPQVQNASRFLIKLPEHTWGCNGAGWWVDTSHQWRNDWFEGNRSLRGYQWCEETYKEQRDFVWYTVEAAKNSVLQPYFERELAELKFDVPDVTGYIPVRNLNSIISLPHFVIQFNSGGGLQKLQCPSLFPLIEWADAANLIGELRYVTLDQQSFNTSLYWGNAVLGRHSNLDDNAHPVSKSWSLTLKSLYVSKDNSSVWAKLEMPAETITKYGGAKDVWIGYSEDSDGTGLTLDVRWFGKTTTRLPEQYFLNFNPLLNTSYGFWMEKMGSFVKPTEVLRGGNQYQHGSWMGAYFCPARPTSPTEFSGINFVSRDAPLLAPICAAGSSKYATPTALIWTADKPCTTFTGVAFNLENNVWNTNYPQYYPFLSPEQDQLSGKDRFVQRIRFRR